LNIKIKHFFVKDGGTSIKAVGIAVDKARAMLGALGYSLMFVENQMQLSACLNPSPLTFAVFSSLRVISPYMKKNL
jgi:hypothetical protein